MVAEDDGPLCMLIKYALETEGYDVEIATRGDEAEIRLQDNVPDLLVLDRMLPAVSGIELGKRLRMRRETMQLPIIMLTARGEERDRVRELATGFDDYLVKPFTSPELTIRVRTLLRRVKPEVLSDVLVVHDITLDRRQHQVFRKRQPVQLSPTEYRLLEFMMQHPGRVISREQLRDRVWGNSVYMDGRAVDVFINRLRKSLKATRNLIRTVRGSGYSIGQATDALRGG